ncbi:LysR family transcriptional regulator [Agrobacterium vitis]|uniref:LysR family transcriptional regulator n=1 Tax=Rhizobium/Agrobacterium group TaxID=227290 RepID=UPI0012E8D2CE|nr:MULTISPECIES: LysR family transcriptional regulator [Rhizobium/Agrobacterium group]MCF1495756.1 LysR family transcriptional regulator [Allorhizobium ampelinum]MVA45809.1 LysR family transcriptional regulator [Agrobacterium vitis]
MNYNSRIDFLGLQAFVAVADRGSFRDAAVHLSLSHTAISHRIRKLEEELGQRLFLRSSREVSLTQLGLELLPEVKQTLGQLTASLEALKLAGKKRQDHLTVACLPTVATGRLPQILNRLRQSHPDVFVQIYDRSAAEIGELVESGKVEFGITLISTHRWDFDSEILIDDPFILVCPEDHPLAGRQTVNWSELEGQPLTRVSRQSGNRMILDDALAESGVRLDWRYEAQHLQTAVAMARSATALAVVPRMAFAAGDGSGLRLIPLLNPSVKRQLGIVSRRGVPLSPIAEKLKSIIKENFG